MNTTEPASKAAAYRWNTIAGLLFTAQSVLMLFVIARVCDVYTAGVFTIAFAVGSLFLNIGMYGMRKFQASDRRHEFTFREYWVSRALTSGAMIAVSLAYVAYTSVTLGYELEKTLVIIVMCLFKVVDVIEDVYSGAYQVEDRLDVGQKMVSLRQLVTLAAFVFVLVATESLLVTMVAVTIFTSLVLAIQVRFVRSRYHLPTIDPSFTWKKVGSLLKQCFPLFAASFLLFYIGSAPKYIIDATMDDAAQAYYGYISMPVFAVNILATFVYNPMIPELSDLWQEGHAREFVLRFAKVSAIIFGLTAVCVLLAALFGVPVLNILYNTDVSGYYIELLVLVGGGAFLAITVWSNVGMTIIRFQHVLIPLYLVLAIAAYIISSFLVTGWGITGASWAYLFSMLATSLVFVAAFLVGVRRLSLRKPPVSR